MRKIPLKNYFVLIVLLAVSAVIVFYLIDWYKGVNKQTSIISDYATKELNYFELDYYINDNPNFILYISNKINNQNKNYENKLKNLLIQKEILSDVVFVALEEFPDSELRKFISKYYSEDYKLKISDTIIIIFESQKIKNIMSQNDDEINMDDTKLFLRENGVY